MSENSNRIDRERILNVVKARLRQNGYKVELYSSNSAGEQWLVTRTGECGAVKLKVDVISLVDRIQADRAPETLCLFQGPVHGRDIDRKSK